MSNSIANFGGEIPRNYDDLLGPVLFKPYADDLAHRMAAHRPRETLELACGTGILTHHLLEKVPPPARITATDLSGDMLAYARGKLGPSDRLEWLPANAMELPFTGGRFDAVVCQFGWMFMPDKAVAAREARRVLRAGGVFFFNAWDGLARNDLARIAQTVLAERFPDNPPQFLPTAFGYNDRRLIASTLERAGFSHVDIVQVEKKDTQASARQVTTGFFTGTPLRHALQERGIASPQELIDSVAARLAKECGDPPGAARLSAFVVCATAE